MDEVMELLSADPPLDDVLRASITELVETFRSGLLALVPVADRAILNWRSVEPHDDWESLAETMFDVFVRHPIGSDEDAPRNLLPLSRYDNDYQSYDGVSWISVGDGPNSDLALVRFVSVEQPFDCAQVVPIDPETRLAGERENLPVAGLSYTLVRRDNGGSRSLVSEIVATE
jgi:hypothetical protein